MMSPRGPPGGGALVALQPLNQVRGFSTGVAHWDDSQRPAASPCDRHLTAVVCGVTLLLAAAAVALSRLASLQREGGGGPATEGYRVRGAAEFQPRFDSEAAAAPAMDWDIVKYSGCEKCHEAEFCELAGNPGCGGTGTADAVTFDNHKRARGCSATPVLTIPRSYVEDIAHLQAKGASPAKRLLSIMLRQGLRLLLA